MVSGEALLGAETATTVTVREGQRVVTDGPFIESKEVLGGYTSSMSRIWTQRSIGRPRSPTSTSVRSRCDR